MGLAGGRTHHKLELEVDRYAPILLLRRGARAYELHLTLTRVTFNMQSAPFLATTNLASAMASLLEIVPIPVFGCCIFMSLFSKWVQVRFSPAFLIPKCLVSINRHSRFSN